MDEHDLDAPELCGCCACTAAAVFFPAFFAAALGRTRAELRDFLSENQVSYTFAREEFVPNPEAQVIKVCRPFFVGTPNIGRVQSRRRRPRAGLVVRTSNLERNGKTR